MGISQFVLVLGANETDFRPMCSGEEQNFSISPIACFSLLRSWSKGQHLCFICCWLCSLISAHHYRFLNNSHEGEYGLREVCHSAEELCN